MGLNDEAEKLRYAKTLLLTCEPTSHQYKAAYEHVGWVLTYTRDAKLREQAQEIADMVLDWKWADPS